MDPNLTTPQQAISSLANIAPFLWPFVLLSLGVALTPVSPISWSYSTWLLFIIPLIIAIFAPIRTFSGPWRYAYLEYASKIGSLAVTLLKAVVINFHSIPTLALPALFFLPVLPVLFFVFFPALPVVWHFISYHYRRRLKAVTASVAKTNESLDLAIARARQAMALAHTYEKQALYTISTTRTTPLLAVSRNSTDFGTPVYNDSEGRWRLIQNSGTLGADLAGKVLDTEKQMAAIEDASQGVRALSEQAVAVATEGDMVAGEGLAENAAYSLEDVVKQVDELRSIAEQARSTWVEFRHRLNKITTSASTTTASLDLAVTQARQAATLAHTYEKQAYSEGYLRLVQSPGTLGADLAGKVLDMEKQMTAIEDASQEVRALLEQAVAVATEGDMVAGEELAENATHSLGNVVKQVDELRLIVDQVRCTWVEFRRRLNDVTASVSTTTTSLDLAVTQARRAATLAHTYEKQAHLEGHWRLIQNPGTLGADLAGKLLDAEKQIAAIEDASQEVRALSEQAVAVATEGGIVAGEELAENAVRSLGDVAKQVDELRSIAEQARCMWIEFRRRLSKVATSASTTSSSLDLAVTQARRAATLAHTYENKALEFVSTTRRTASQTLALHDADFFEQSTQVRQARQTISDEAEKVRALGSGLTDKMLLVEGGVGDIEFEAESIRALLEQAVTATKDGDVATGESLTASAAESLKAVVESVQGLCSTTDDVRQAWIELSVEYWAIP